MIGTPVAGAGAHGLASLNAAGFCREMQPHRRGELRLDLRMPLPRPGYLERYLRDHDWEVRPDERPCLIGENAWQHLGAGVTGWREYEFMFKTSPMTMTVNRRAVPFEVRVRPVYFNYADPSFPKWWPALLGFSGQLNPEIQTLGWSFLRHGLTLWQQDGTYFFPRADSLRPFMLMRRTGDLFATEAGPDGPDDLASPLRRE